MLKLNIGSGSTKLDGYINMDISDECKPDIVHDFRKGLPYPNNHFDEIVMFHCIEHIEKKHHEFLFLEVARVLKPESDFILTFPDFARCAQNWLDNKQGMRNFWEATIYGRQLYPSDYHVCVCTVDGMARQLSKIGLDPFWQGYEKDSANGMSCNGIVRARKVKVVTYEETLVDSIR